MNNFTRFELSAVLAAVAGIIAHLLGGWDRAAHILTLFMVIDYMTGCASAIKSKSMSSSVGFVGLLKKATTYLIIIVAVQLDSIANTNGYIRTSTIFFFICNEGISILENASEIGIRLPTFLKNTLVKLRDKHTAEIENNETASNQDTSNKESDGD